MRVLDADDAGQIMPDLESSEADFDRAGAVRENEILIGLIGGIYEASLDPAQWKGVLDALGSFINPGADLFFHAESNPRKWLDIANAMLEDPADESTSGAPMRRRPGVTDDARRRLAVVLPHLSRALQMGEDIVRSRTEAAALAETVDGLGAGLFILDDVTRILHTNSAARELLAAEDVLCSRGGRLVAFDPKANRSLRLALSAADGPMDVTPRLLPLIAANGTRRVGHIRPLRPAAGSYGARKPLAAMLVYKAGMECPSAPDIIARSYNLTPSELRVLLAIVEIGGTPDVAAVLGIAPSTVRTHVGRLFEKTGTKRQAELVRLVAGFVSPFQLG